MIPERDECGPCPFCGATDRSAMPVMVRDVCRPGDDRVAYAVSLAHGSRCPRRGAMIPASAVAGDSRATRADVAAVEVAAAEDMLRHRVPPGEDRPAVAHRPFGHVARDVDRVGALAEIVGVAVHGALARADLGESPGELSATLVMVGCGVAASSDSNLIPPFFLASFLPDLGVTEAEAIGLVRLCYTEHRQREEETVERERIALEVERVRAEEAERARVGN